MKKMNGIEIWRPAARTIAIGMVAALMLMGTAMGEVSRTGLVAEYHFDGDAKDSSGKTCSHCESTVPMQASFCGECGGN